jgi:anthranilate/para-aminobenzoate synthase component I
MNPLSLDAGSTEGLVWIDSADGSGPSFAGSSPELVMEGGPGDWDHLGKELELRGRPGSGGGVPDGAAVGYFRFDGSFRFGFYDNLFPCHGTHGSAALTAPRLAFRSATDSESYGRMVRAAQEYIRAGDIYQVCLAHRFSAAFHGDRLGLYQALRHASPSPYASFLHLGDETVLSSSPECFLRIDGRSILTRPIKGTRPRRGDKDEDAAEARELLLSSKETAELVMITDLERNDLGSICEFGSVRTTDLLRLETFAQVHHLVSTVEGTLRSDITHAGAVAACFPGGSVTGAPKKRAIEIIRELEAVPRDLFTGAVGYFGYDGRTQFSIAIRTIVLREGVATFHVGAGITAGSDPVKEWEETLHKAAGILKAAGSEHPLP